MTTSMWIVNFSFPSTSVPLTVLDLSCSKKRTHSMHYLYEKKPDTNIYSSHKNLSLQSPLISSDAHFKITRSRYKTVSRPLLDTFFEFFVDICLARYSSSLSSALDTDPLSRERR